MLLVFVLGLVVSATFSTQETRQEEATDRREDAWRALVGLFLEEGSVSARARMAVGKGCRGRPARYAAARMARAATVRRR